MLKLSNKTCKYVCNFNEIMKLISLQDISPVISMNKTKIINFIFSTFFLKRHSVQTFRCEAMARTLLLNRPFPNNLFGNLRWWLGPLWCRVIGTQSLIMFNHPVISAKSPCPTLDTFLLASLLRLPLVSIARRTANKRGYWIISIIIGH